MSNDYATTINIIKQGLVIMNPTSGASQNLLQDAEELDNAAWVDFSEIRFFLETEPPPRPGLSFYFPPTEEEIELMEELDRAGGDSRNYQEQFYQPFKKAIAHGVRNYVLSYVYRNYSSPVYTITDDHATGVITVKWSPPSGAHAPDRIYKVPKVVRGLLDRLPYQDLADLADIFFSIWNLSTSDTWAAKEQFFARIRLHFELYDLNRLNLLFLTLSMSVTSVSTDYEEFISEIWMSLKTNLIEEFGAGSEDIGELEDAFTFKAPIPPSEFPFMTFPINDINLGLRLVYRQEWRPLGIQRGEVVRTIPLGPKETEKVSTKITRRTKVTRTSESLKSTEMSTETSDTVKDSSEIVNEAANAMKWNINQEIEGGYNCGVWNIGGKTSGGIESESTDSTKETSSHLSESMQKIANKVRTETKVVVSTEAETTFELSTASEIQNPNDEIAVTYVFSKLQRQYEILTRLAEVQDVIMVAEELPRPGDINFDWVKKYDWIIAKVLLDDSFREALSSISQEAGQPNMRKITEDLRLTQTETIKHLGTFAETAHVTAQDIDFVEESQKGFLTTAKEQLERLRQNYLLDAKRYRLYEHIRENILHYCRAIWQHEDPQQRLLRYQKFGMMVPQDWWFQPDTGTPMTIDEFESLSETGIRGNFVADMSGDLISLKDLINPAGPIAFYGNYSVYYMRPEYASDSNIMPLLEIFKSPYVYNGELMDPVQKMYEEEYDGVTIPNDTIDQCWEDMMDYVPDLKLKYLKEQKRLPDDEKDKSAIEVLGRGIFKEFYPEYLFRKEQTRRFLVDTNCLIIDLERGEGSVLEPFKQMHRMIDVLKADAEKKKMELENERRRKLLDMDKLGDPDIEKVIIVADNKDHISSIVAGIDAGRSDTDSG